jgi:hypothetical protein
MKKMLIVFVLLGCLAGCAQNVLKAPCNAAGSNCWPRTKINQWNQ